MPHITTKYRLFCKSCNDYTIHSASIDETISTICSCGNTYSSTLLSDIPEKSMFQQRSRYVQYRMNKTREMYNKYTNLLSDIMSDTQQEIIETDAGLLAIEEREELLRNEHRKSKLDELAKFKSLGRNSECLCSSGLKYKKCCLTKHQNWK